jgi:hypothetical protein
MKCLITLLTIVAAGSFAGAARAQGPGCMRGSLQTGSMMSPQGNSLGMMNLQSTYLQQAQLAYQYQLQLAQLQQQLQLEQAAMKQQTDQAAKKSALREQRLAARRERQESDKARRAAAKADTAARQATDSKLALSRSSAQ